MENTKTGIGLDNPIFEGRLRLAFARSPATNNNPETKHYGSGDVLPVTEKLFSTKPVPARRPKTTNSQLANTQDLQDIEARPTEPIRFGFDDIEASRTNSPYKKFRAKRTRQKLVSNLMISLAVLLLTFGIYVAVSGLLANKAIQNVVNAQKSNPAAAGYKEDKPTDDDLNNYHVAPDMPRFIEIQKLDVKARVRSLGVTGDNQLAVPSNVFDVGWYDQSAKPGAGAGASVIDGHVSGPTQPGTFYGLKDLQNGDVVTIERGDGKKFNFKVVAKEAKAPNKIDMAKVLVSHNPNRAGLNLITCTGAVTGHEYSQRLVVYTEAMF